MSRINQAVPTSMRGDIEGLRAVAVLMVLLYHARIPGVSGGFAGVDVFFVISGFLITSLLVREVQKSGRISVATFYARRARRLLPAATLVLVVTGAVGSFLFTAGVRGQLGREILASTFYVVNWELASQAVDYLAEDASPSAVQHYWSLSVEEQFYVVWPLLMIAAVIIAGRLARSPFRSMVVVLSCATAGSFGWSVYLTEASPGTAYFATTTRVWELGFGALLAFGVSRLAHVPARVAEVVAAGGVAAIAISAFVVTSNTPWPGSAALLPVVGTTAVIAAGCSKNPTVISRLLGVSPLRFIGGISYSLYLWHWPLLVFLDEARPGTGLRGRLAVLALAVALAYLTKRWVEDPIRFARSLAVSPPRAIAWGGGAMAISSAVAVAVLVTTPRLAEELPEWAQGAQALMVDSSAPEPEIRSSLSAALPDSGRIYPAPELAPKDVPDLYADGCQVGVEQTEPIPCDYGDTTSATIVAVVGDSKVAQWLPALDIIGKKEGWLIRTYTKSACAFTDADTKVEAEVYDSCREWGERVIDTLTGEEKAALVITSAGRSQASQDGSDPNKKTMIAGYTTYWETLNSAGVGVVALADNSHPGTEVYTCVDDNRKQFSQCDFPAEEGGGTSSLKAAAENVSGATFIDLSPWLCPAEKCSAVIGDVLVYRQGSHITASYVETLAPVLRAALVPVVERVRANAP